MVGDINKVIENKVLTQLDNEISSKNDVYSYEKEFSIDLNVTLNLNNNNIELWDNQEYKDRNMPDPMILENRLEVYN